MTPFIDAVWSSPPRLVASGEPVGRCMAEVASWGEEMLPRREWRGFEGIDYEAGVDALRTWVPDALRDLPPVPPVRGLFFELTEYDERMIRLAGTGSYGPDDWACGDHLEFGQLRSDGFRAHVKLGG